MAKATDYWTGRFAPAGPHNAGAGTAMYRKCLHCGGHALEGSLSVHARWCDQQRQTSLAQAALEEQRLEQDRAANRAKNSPTYDRVATAAAMRLDMRFEVRS